MYRLSSTDYQKLAEKFDIFGDYEIADYYDKQNKSQIDSVDNNFLRENDPRMPLFSERKTKVTFGSGT